MGNRCFRDRGRPRSGRWLLFLALHRGDGALKADLRMRSVAEGLGRRSAASAEYRFLYRNLSAQRIDEPEFAVDEIRSVVSNFDCDRHGSSEDWICSAVVYVPLIGVTRKLDRHGVFDIDGDLVVTAADLDVVLGHRQIVLARFAQNISANLVVVVRAGGLRLVDDFLTELGSLDLHRDHLEGDEHTDRQDDQTDETPHLTFALLAAAESHRSSTQQKKYKAKLLNGFEKPLDSQ